MSRAAALETAGLTKFYGSTRGIEDLDLRVEEGEVFGYLGPNGAGKTTTIRLLLDLIRPTRGSARIAGHDTRAESVEVRWVPLDGVAALPLHPAFADAWPTLLARITAAPGPIPPQA